MSHQAKAKYAVLKAIEFIAESFTRATFATFTFGENILSKREAAKRWRRLKARLRYRFPDLLGVGVWQRQKRGAWHLHLVVSQRVSIEWLRDAALACGFGSYVNLKAVDIRDRNVFNFDRSPIAGAREVARYITRYLSRGRETCDKGVRVVEYLGREARVQTMRFSWVGGFARLWRAGVAEWFKTWGVRPSYEIFDEVIQLGWDALSAADRSFLLSTSRKVFEWRNPDLFPF